MRDNLFRRVDRRFREEQDTDQIIEDLWDDLDDEEFREEIREDFRGELETIIKHPDHIYEIDDVMINLLEKGLDQLDSSFEELLDYLEERNEDNGQVYRSLENFLLSWRTFLILSQSIQRNPPEEYCEAVESILRGARKSDAEAVDELLDEQIQANTLVNGFKKTWSNFPQGDEPQEKRLVTKIEIIEDLFETLMKPTGIFIGKLISIEVGHSTSVDTSDVLNRFDSGEYDQSHFWDERARHIRNASAHKDYVTWENSILVFDREWERTLNEDKLDEIIASTATKPRNTLYALSVIFEEEYSGVEE